MSFEADIRKYRRRQRIATGVAIVSGSLVVLVAVVGRVLR